jgi:hypothetical protein
LGLLLEIVERKSQSTGSGRARQETDEMDLALDELAPVVEVEALVLAVRA